MLDLTENNKFFQETKQIVPRATHNLGKCQGFQERWSDSHKCTLLQIKARRMKVYRKSCMSIVVLIPLQNAVFVLSSFEAHGIYKWKEWSSSGS